MPAHDVSCDLVDTAANSWRPLNALDLAGVLTQLPQLFENLRAGLREVGEWAKDTPLAADTATRIEELAASMSFAADSARTLNTDFRRDHRFWLEGQAS